jgi:DNA polymerase III delta prime subunit
MDNENNLHPSEPAFVQVKRQLVHDSAPWVEKYRPLYLKDVLLDKNTRLFFNKACQTENIPNLLFYGPPGTGKTSAILALLRDFQPTRKKEVLHLNASDERGIDVIRTQISNFVSSSSFFRDSMKFVILDEVDNMTKNAQYGLSYLMHSQYNDADGTNLRNGGSIVRFCLICNYISKIIPSLKHEFVCMRFNKLPKSLVASFLGNIARKENIVISNRTIWSLYDRYGSDLRGMINYLQSMSDMNDPTLVSALPKIDKILGIKCSASECGSSAFLKEMLECAKNTSIKEILKEHFSLYLEKLCYEDHQEQPDSFSLNLVEYVLHMPDEKNFSDFLLVYFKRLYCTCCSHLD